MKNKIKKHQEEYIHGFTLIEIILYISLLSILMIGVFSFILPSFYIGMKKPTFSDEYHQLLIKSYHVK